MCAHHGSSLTFLCHTTLSYTVGRKLLHARGFRQGKSALVLFYHMNSCVQCEVFEISDSFGLYASSFDCLCKPYVLT